MRIHPRIEFLVGKIVDDLFGEFEDKRELRRRILAVARETSLLQREADEAFFGVLGFRPKDRPTPIVGSVE